MLSFSVLMNDQETRQESDEILRPFLQATEAVEAERLLVYLVSEHVEPVARPIIKYKTYAFTGHSRSAQDAEDIHSDVMVRLIRRLQELRNDPDRTPITSFRSYIKIVAVNACSEFLRKKYPQRSSLQDKLRYVLTHRQGLALWKGLEPEWLCGLSRWRDQIQTRSRSARLEQLRDNPNSCIEAILPHQNIQQTPLPDLLSALFNWTDGPIELDDLVRIVADLQGIRDQAALSAIGQSPTDEGGEIEIRDTRIGADTELSQRVMLQRLWTEVCLLPLRQRFALLMNLKDDQGQDVTGLLPLVGVCTFREIAEALALTVEQFAELAKDLPLDDATIARHLDITRQQVINLRKSARERLARRLKSLDK